ncbi:MAG: putative toxin-antitoxin system toxin component, PIN family [Chloroflexi bacterium]|nr:putative toxin-antitoxin system toxin component, PIN family [Chloroflexota bacterium]MBM3172531.1 putative toxin-antitoxin system toxin component, PIN family [Chloroflexota bacterium]MBM3175066.1 putative toxin-antitoxin system toxin component, PIN family [Chloroflexota bacterium]MBM4450306.1 putative toxin-antitoxin system toxin component, PIN family [Chloroflexota bacterium]
MLRAVVDTNVLVSSFISPLGSPREIERRWRNREFMLITSPAIIKEVNRVLHLPRIQQKYHLTESDIQAFVLALAHQAYCVAGRLALNDVAPDPCDDKIISCAVEGKADFIVTSDRRLRELGEYQGIRIVSAESFIGILEQT